jgi:sugar/nucleoside kinase (ribokinase family)
MTARVLVIGDVMTDISVALSGPIVLGSDRRAAISVQPGGSAATQAVWLARHGLHVDFVGRVGAADHAEQSGLFARQGVTPHLAADPSLETGRLIAVVDPSGERSFLTDRGANDALASEDAPDALIASADHIHISGYAFFAENPRATAISVIRRAGGKPVSVDPGSAGFLREVGAAAFLDWIDGVKILFPNAEEAEMLAGSADAAVQREVLTRRFPLVVVKRGAAGAEVWRGEEVFRLPAPVVPVVDTTGAGDAFAAAFLAARLGGETVEGCLGKAVAAGSATVGFMGARPEAPPFWRRP